MTDYVKTLEVENKALQRKIIENEQYIQTLTQAVNIYQKVIADMTIEMTTQATKFQNELLDQAEHIKKTFELTRQLEIDEDMRVAAEQDRLDEIERIEHEKRLDELYQAEVEGRRWHRD